MEKGLKEIAQEHQGLEQAKIELIQKTAAFNTSVKKFLIEHEIVDVLTINWNMIEKYIRND